MQAAHAQAMWQRQGSLIADPLQSDPFLDNPESYAVGFAFGQPQVPFLQPSQLPQQLQPQHYVACAEPVRDTNHVATPAAAGLHIRSFGVSSTYDLQFDKRHLLAGSSRAVAGLPRSNPLLPSPASTSDNSQGSVQLQSSPTALVPMHTVGLGCAPINSFYQESELEEALAAQRLAIPYSGQAHGDVGRCPVPPYTSGSPAMNTRVSTTLSGPIPVPPHKLTEPSPSVLTEPSFALTELLAAAPKQRSSARLGRKRAPAIDFETVEDPEERKRLIKLARNRATAAACRKRKREALEYVSERVQELEAENAQLRYLLLGRQGGASGVFERLGAVGERQARHNCAK